MGIPNDGGMPGDAERLLAQLDRLVESGQVTSEEAARLRAADGTADQEHVVIAIRSRHAASRLAAAVAAGQMSREEADVNLDRLVDVRVIPWPAVHGIPHRAPAGVLVDGGSLGGGLWAEDGDDLVGEVVGGGAAEPTGDDDGFGAGADADEPDAAGGAAFGRE